jgi:pimeloyl-ACP methyl ester carboxylesterase
MACSPSQVCVTTSGWLVGHDMRASFEWFRSLAKDVKDTAAYAKAKLPMPVLAVGAEGSLADFVPKQIRQYADNVTGVVIKDSGHWIYEEQPRQMLERLREFLQ